MLEDGPGVFGTCRVPDWKVVVDEESECFSALLGFEMQNSPSRRSVLFNCFPVAVVEELNVHIQPGPG